MPGVDSFDRNVGQYEQWFADHPLAYVSELRAVRELLPEGSGLEIGVGTGRFAAPLGIKMGVEPSKAMAELARRKGVDVRQGVAERLPFKENEFDFCLMVTTVCFLDDMDLAFKEAYRVLRPGGAFVIGLVDRESALGREYQQKKDTSVFYKEAVFHSVMDITAHLETAGFGRFQYRQTLFNPIDEMEEVDPVKEGHGKGSFVVMRGEKG